MSPLFEVRIRMGGDPRALDQFKAIQQELAKLNHPACPEVDWVKIERACLDIFEQHGAELQTAVAFVLARSHRAGLAGMGEGLALLARLIEEWPRLWPVQASVRIDLLGGLFAQLQPILRTMHWGPDRVSGLNYLAVELARFESRLFEVAPVTVAPLQSLRSLVDLFMQRLSEQRIQAVPVQHWASSPVSAFVAPAVLPPPLQNTYRLVIEPQAKKRSFLPWLLVMGLVIALSGVGGWQYWRAYHASQVLTPEPIQLESLSLFAPGSAQFKPDSTKSLMSALVEIKTRPGWLIMISGHADASGQVSSNLELSRARASAVRDWLQQMGDIPDSCFVVRGAAANQPLTSNETTSGRATNRRVDIRLLPASGACGEVDQASR